MTGRHRFLRILALHVGLGMPLSAAGHTLVQTAAATGELSVPVTALHFVLGVVVGAPVLGPAWALQALSAWLLERRGLGRGWRMVAGGALQTSFVAAWAATVGIEPSLPGRFPMTVPMMGVALMTGVLVAAVGVPRKPAGGG